MKVLNIKGVNVLLDDEDYEWISTLTGWFINNSGYAQLHKSARVTKNKPRMFSALMHRLVMFARAGQILDHKDRNRLNNQKSNLRFCTRSQNAYNSKKSRNTIRKYKCVSKHKSGWIAMLEGRYLGKFDTEHLAALMVDFWMLERRKEFANTNFTPVKHNFF